ncbi:MAG: FlgD immunoglobulin-like domain containing protein [Calditrichia bacterium]
MLKKATVLVLIFVLVGAFSAVNAKVADKVQMVPQTKLSKISETKYRYSDNNVQHNLTVSNSPAATSVIDTMYWYYEPYMTNGSLADFLAPGDTVIQDYKLIPDPAQLVMIRGLFSTGGSAETFVWKGSDDGASRYPGDVLATKTWDVTGTSASEMAWDEIDFSGDNLELPSSTDPNPDNRPFFVVGYVATVDASDPTVGAPGVFFDYNNTYPYGGTPIRHSRFTSGGDGNWYSIVYGTAPNYSYWAQWTMQVVVNYYNGTSPFVLGMSQLNDTWNTSGFKSVLAQIQDIDGTITSTELYYQKNSETPQSVAETSSNLDIYYYDIPGSYAPGDTVTYWVQATDNDGKSINGEARSFLVLEPQNPAAEVLVVYQDLAAAPEFYNEVVDSVLSRKLNKGYEVWNVSAHNGIDKSVVDYTSFKQAVILGFGVSSVPVGDYSNSVWKDFVESGKPLFLASPDYLYSNGVGGAYTAQPGDFLYDVFGAGDVVSDPTDDAGNSNADNQMIGIENDPVSGTWAANLLKLNFDAFLGGTNWTDYANADASNSNAATVFIGTISGSGMGVRNVNSFGGATVYLPFDLSAVADTNDVGDPLILPDAYALLENGVNYINTFTAIGDVAPKANMSYELKANYPNPFNPITTIEYTLPEKSNVTLNVYNLLGEKVKTLVNSSQAAKSYRVTWDGTNDRGVKVASGIYIYKINAGNFAESRKMILMK